MNNIEEVINRPCDSSAFKFGISVLHAYIRCYEYLLHIAYKLENQEWKATTLAQKKSVKNKKTAMSSEFYSKLGLVVDQPKQGGGNSNDGNTARKFFDNPATVSEITGIDEKLILKFSYILSAISSGHIINIKNFKSSCLETAHMCVHLYGWYKMSATVHKLLIHGGDIIQSLPLPVGQLSEDVLEASHKSYKNLRLYHARKTSRINTNTDIMHWMLVSSDPIITSWRKSKKKESKPFSKEVLDLLKEPEITMDLSDAESDNPKDDSESIITDVSD